MAKIAKVERIRIRMQKCSGKNAEVKMQMPK